MGKGFPPIRKIHLERQDVSQLPRSPKNHIVPAFRTRKLATIRPYEIQQWFQELLERPLSISTVLTIRRIFEVVLSEAVRNGLIDKNPVRLARPPKYKKKPIRIMSLEQMQELLRLAKSKPMKVPTTLAQTTCKRCITFLFT